MDFRPKKEEVNELAGATQEPVAPEPNPDTARQVFPVMFEKDDMDFRPTDPDVKEASAPKFSSAPASVVSQPSPTGLEDVSEEDLVTTAQVPAEKDKNQTTTTQTGSGTQAS